MDLSDPVDARQMREGVNCKILTWEEGSIARFLERTSQYADLKQKSLVL